MELVKNIFFNTDKLVENTKIKISYTGKLFEENSSNVYLHYGYGLQWDNVSEVEMVKTELGYQAEIELMSSDSLNLCFRNSNNEWDNNNGQNYTFPIEKVEVALVPQNVSSVLRCRIFSCFPLYNLFYERLCFPVVLDQPFYYLL